MSAAKFIAIGIAAEAIEHGGVSFKLRDVKLELELSAVFGQYGAAIAESRLVLSWQPDQ